MEAKIYKILDQFKLETSGQNTIIDGKVYLIYKNKDMIVGVNPKQVTTTISGNRITTKIEEVLDVVSHVCKVKKQITISMLLYGDCYVTA